MSYHRHPVACYKHHLRTVKIACQDEEDGWSRVITLGCDSCNERVEIRSRVRTLPVINGEPFIRSL